MSDIIQVRHPVPVRHVSGSREVLSLDRVTTPVRLREIDAVEMPEAGCVRSPGIFRDVVRTPLHLHEGSLWLALTQESGVPVGRGFFESLYDGTLPEWHGNSTGIMHPLARTPLLASKSPGWSRGEPLNRRRAGTILYDGAEPARAALVRYLDEELRVAGGIVFTRLPGPLARWDRGTDSAAFRIDLSPRLNSHDQDFGRYDRLGEAWSYLRASRAYCATIKESPSLVDADIPDGLEGRDDDLVINANAMPSSLLAQLAGLIRHRLPQGADPSLLIERGALLRHRSDAGLISANAMSDVEGIMLAIADLARPVLDAVPANTPGVSSFRDALLYAETVALPRIRGTDPDDAADMEAFAGMAP